MIDPDSPVPAYAQLAGILRQKISSGEITSVLPSNRALQQEYGLGEYAVTHALAVLADEDLIYSVPRRGYYVRQRPGPEARG